MEFASNAKGNAALTTGIIGTAGVGLGLRQQLKEFVGIGADVAAEILHGGHPGTVEEETVADAVRDAGFTIKEIMADSEWRAIVAVKDQQ